MNNSASLTLVQGPSTVTCMVVTSLYHNYPTDFINSLQWVKASVNTNLCTEFLLQIWKQQEDSAMLLASNKKPSLHFVKVGKRVAEPLYSKRFSAESIQEYYPIAYQIHKIRYTSKG
jgi:peptidoglycan hydrolase-like amidase